ncbi:hypothetical protein Zm00014a_002326 [Zea mays]|jgi:hypothetical protein|uniref:Uncharacterized protein n=2 Tax=Zea mays TaxID=4577 RepID=A0A1D6Q8V1_MAIZE|nr:hypothetical protein ZEAMMB73_Zm00001d051659 [Zea mays]PWZ27751.1 hypothetical protein Zm00014a_002326 [Zea mays]
MAGATAEEPLVGDGAGASAASATVAEAATRTAQAIFFISIPGCGGLLATVETAAAGWDGGEEVSLCSDDRLPG